MNFIVFIGAKKMQSVHRKRPHLLPPLSNSQPSALRVDDSDMFLMEKRLGSPAPKPSGPVEADYFCEDSNKNPVITINGPCQWESEKYSCMNFDLPSNFIVDKTKISVFETQNTDKLNALGPKTERRKALLTNLSPKKWEKTSNYFNKNIKPKMVLPLEKNDNVNSKDLKSFPIPNRYTLLKPIGERN